MVLKTKSFTIRRFTLSDIDELVRSFGQSEILRAVRGKTWKYARTDAKKYVAEKLKQYKRKKLITKNGETETLGYAIKTGGRLIGGIGFTAFGHKAEIGYWLAKPYWGRGMMAKMVREFVTYLRKKYHFTRFEAKVFIFNRASTRVLEKNRFRFEGRLVKNVKIGRRYLDHLLNAKTF